MSTPTSARPSRRSLQRSLHRPLGLTAALALPLAALVACGDGATEGASPAARPAPSGAPSSSSSPSGATAAPAAPTEVATDTPRLVVTYEGGDIGVFDATTLEPVADLELPGYNRVNAAGDGRHVLVSTTGGFQVLDAGTWEEPHGDHGHYYTSDPVLTDVVHEAVKPAHVVTHAGRTALFDDGTGASVVVDSASIADPDAQARVVEAPAAHHGVAVEMADGRLVTTEGTEDERSTIVLRDAGGAEIARTDDCPGMHGEATAADEVAVVGCEDGIVIVRGEELLKVAAPDAYGRIGNQAGSDTSPVVLGDYKRDADAEVPEPTQTVSLTDTATGELQLVDLPSSYTFRSLGRGEDGEALVLGTDGSLHVVDEETGELERSIPVVAAWTEPEDWQEPRPALRVHEGTAYVTEPATREVHAVDVETGEVFATAALEQVPDEVVVATGTAAEGAPEGEHAHEGEHEDHEHEDEAAEESTR
ncbi:zinc metallochaperone AztD [uncultured Pseudokineococcus sp.]|uniref:zinc metallochaperone AztD n=1 Tax=uncultured Pseudokineococcus sp. TaxID=1642928 RepID=UPI002629C5BC|nr:zinc metallochaperone AztD [uncultured Pseudokineococcus sp.]